MRIRALSLLLPLAAAALLLAPAASAVNIDWVTVGAPGNAADTQRCPSAEKAPIVPCGAVPYTYQIAKYETTNAQYAEFLNAKAAADPYALYYTGMETDVYFGGITRSGSSGSYATA